MYFGILVFREEAMNLFSLRSRAREIVASKRDQIDRERADSDTVSGARIRRAAANMISGVDCSTEDGAVRHLAARHLERTYPNGYI